MGVGGWCRWRTVKVNVYSVTTDKPPGTHSVQIMFRVGVYHIILSVAAFGI